jgi:hypothetical protein
MVSSRLYELLAESEAKPSGALQDLQAAVGAGTGVVDAIRGYQENKLGRTKLADIFGAQSDVATRFPNLRLKDLERKGLGDLLKLELENAPTDIVVPQFDPKTGQATGLANLGKQNKRTKVVQGPSINIWKGQELQQKRDEAYIAKLQKERDALAKQVGELTIDDVGIVAMPENQPRVDALRTRMDKLDRLILGGDDTGSTSPAQTPVPAATPSRPLEPVDLRKPKQSFSSPGFSDLSPTAPASAPAPVTMPAAQPAARPATRAKATAPMAQRAWEDIPADHKRESSKGKFFYDPDAKVWKNHDTGQVVK